MSLESVIRFANYQLTARNEHALHSPFLFDFYLNVIKDNTPFYALDEIVDTYTKLLRNNEVIEVTDYGAGSKVSKGSKRSISEIAKSAVKNQKYGALLFRISNFAQPKTIIELGTSLGISTAYLAKPSQATKVYTFEGCPNIASKATQTFEKLNLSNISLNVGEFGETLPSALLKMEQIDIAFIDGNHQEQPTIDYFNMIITKCSDSAILILDDINWSTGMLQAWKKIQADKRVSATIDLFHLGIVFLNKDLSKQNFKLRF